MSLQKQETDSKVDSLVPSTINEQSQQVSCNSRIKELEELLITNTTDSENQIHQMQMKYNELQKELERSHKDHEAMVVKYAESQKNIIDFKKNHNLLNKKIEEFLKEKDIFINKIKILSNEKIRLGNLFDEKLNECIVSNKALNEAQENIIRKEAEITFYKTKLKNEMDTHQETQIKLEVSMKKQKECFEEIDQVRQECQQWMKAYTESEEGRAFSLDKQINENDIQLSNENLNIHKATKVYQNSEKQIETLKQKLSDSIEEGHNLNKRIQTLEEERLHYEETVSKLKEIISNQSKDLSEFQQTLKNMKDLQLQLDGQKEKLQISLEEADRLRKENSEIQHDMTICHLKMGEMLDFTKKITEKNVYLQSELNIIEEEFQEMTVKHQQQLEQIDKLKTDLEKLNMQISSEQNQKQNDLQLMAMQIAEKVVEVENLEKQLSDAKVELHIAQKKYHCCMKEMTREIQVLKKKTEELENKQELCSRTSSTQSLDSNNSTNSLLLNLDPHQQQKLLEKIIKLEKSLFKKKDRIEYLEEVCQNFAKQLEKKTNIIQSYVLKEETEKEMLKNNFFKAPVQMETNGMTYELCLEINQKLQCILEDTLLKNITLQENLNTLANELSALKKSKQ